MLGRPMTLAFVLGVRIAFAEPAAVPAGTIVRAELDRFLQQSPALVLRAVDPDPVFRNGRFYGWKLGRFFPDDPRFVGAGLQAGDIVRRVNQNTVERPEQLAALWASLRSAETLQVDCERAGALRSLRWTIAREKLK